MQVSRRTWWRWLGAAAVVLQACSGPTSPRTPDDPAAPTPPVIRSIAVPTTRVEAGVTVEISAVVEDAETALDQLAYQWTASAGVISGTGLNATWQMPKGITAGMDVTVRLTVTETYQIRVNQQLVTRQHVVTSTSTPFRVHDSEAETKELARKFLVDLFGNSSVPAEACMVDFAEACAGLPEGRDEEYLQIVRHREQVIVYSATVLAQRFERPSLDAGSVHTAMLYDDQIIGQPPKPPTCGDFEVSVVYLGGRWWICQSFFNEEDTSSCPVPGSNSDVARILRGRIPGLR